ncbi:MAG: CHAD domain-containing protein [Aggregatilineales bacterium]
MLNIHDDLIAQLKDHREPVHPEDTMAEAGRKVLLGEFIHMLENEAGSRLGEDIEYVHDMRVATRRMRTTLRLLEPYYKPKAVRAYRRALRKIARALGAVRDLDVLIDDMTKFKDTLDPAQQEDLQTVIDALDKERAAARHDLNRLFDKSEYQDFIDDFARFLLRTGTGVRPLDGDVHPYQVRHVLPVLLYSHLAAVRAYDDVLSEADDTVLHALRIEFKQLRYAASLFEDVLGSSVKDYIKSIKAAQDHLGRMQDIAMTEAKLTGLAPLLSAGQLETLGLYLDHIRAERDLLRQQVAEMWRQFNRRTVQRHLASAVVAL